MTTSDNQDEQGLAEQPFVTHLLELRDRLLRMAIAAFVIFVLLFPFANDLYTVLAAPLIKHLPEGTGMIATRVISPFLTPLKLVFVMTILTKHLEFNMLKPCVIFATKVLPRKTFTRS